MIRIALAAFAVLMFSTQISHSADAFCLEPVTPIPPSYSGRPKFPNCLRNYALTREHDCSLFEIEDYKSNVADYVQKFKFYVFDIQSYVSAAADYADCEINAVVEHVK